MMPPKRKAMSRISSNGAEAAAGCCAAAVSATATGRRHENNTAQAVHQRAAPRLLFVQPKPRATLPTATRRVNRYRRYRAQRPQKLRRTAEAMLPIDKRQ